MEELRAAASRMRIADPSATRIDTDVDVATSMFRFDGARVLDLGCGAALFSRLLALKHPTGNFVALDVDRRAHEKNLASEKPANLTFGLGGAESIPAPDASFDMVTMIKSLHHVPLERLDDAMAEVRRVLHPGGYFFVLEPIFAGDHNEVMRVFHDEERVRQEAFEATRRAVAAGLFDLVEEVFFLNEAKYADFEAFHRKHIGVTHTEHKLTKEQLAEVKRRFARNMGPGGARFLSPMRVQLLRRPA
jgi:ubiquinone/menaquinone biosynthesis C-methylase UbiE